MKKKKDERVKGKKKKKSHKKTACKKTMEQISYILLIYTYSYFISHFRSIDNTLKSVVRSCRT